MSPFARRKRRAKPIPVLTLFSASLLVLASCSRTGAPVEAHAPDTAPTVAVAEAASRDLSRSTTLTAEFRPYQEVDVMAKVSGYVQKILVDVGDRVAQGQLLAVLEIPEMREDITRAGAALNRSRSDVQHAREELQRAEASHNATHLAYQRLEGVSESRPGLVAQQEIDEARGKDLVSEAQVAAAKSAISSTEEQVQVGEAENAKVNTLYGYTRVTAPFAGVITKRYADTGSMIQAGTASQTQAMPLVRVSQNGLLRLILPVPESQVPSIRIGQRVAVNVPSIGRDFDGRIARYTGKVQQATRTMETEVDVPNPRLTIKPGMFAEVALSLERHDHVITVPVQAIAGTETAPLVYVVAAHTIVERPVVLGMQISDLTEIKSGLHAGELVVVGNKAQLRPGETVIPKVVDMKSDKGAA